MSYAVKEIFFTLQGEGGQAGRPLFLSFCRCNLWSGLERDRATAQCRFCDTDFVGTDGQNGVNSPMLKLWQWPLQHWPEAEPGADALVVFTGGEPCLQLNATLLEAVSHKALKQPSRLMELCLCQRKSTGFVLVQNPKARLFNRPVMN